MKNKLLVIFSLFFLSQVAFAQQDEPTDFDFATSYIANKCDFDRLISNGLNFDKWFSEYDEFITQKALVACRAIYDEKTETPNVDDYWPADVLTEILQKNLSQLNTAFLEKDQGHFGVLQASYIAWLSESTLPIVRGVPQPAHFDSVWSDFNRAYFISTPTGLPRKKEERFILSAEQNAECVNRFAGAEDCVEVFNAFNKINRKLSVFQRLNGAQKHNAYVAFQEAKWDKFSDSSRFQTFIDVAFTSWVYREHFSRADDLITPPPLQLFALRPSLVMEHLSDANKGDKDEPALALEWVGFNAWDLKVPFGISVTSVYADRATGKSVGHGLTFHVNNSFSFGFANRGGGDNSFYLNIELMDWFGEKMDMFKAYK
ncbi:hypothetical protein [Rheinheimera sp.]|uniref:hypothetical protein n=1 Tax=Rheinheimera sp. TaxID=1869214 RepID=UPI003D2677C5